jgi:hypothetical protein
MARLWPAVPVSEPCGRIGELAKSPLPSKLRGTTAEHSSRCAQADELRSTLRDFCLHGLATNFRDTNLTNYIDRYFHSMGLDRKAALNRHGGGRRSIAGRDGLFIDLSPRGRNGCGHDTYLERVPLWQV